MNSGKLFYTHIVTEALYGTQEIIARLAIWQKWRASWIYGTLPTVVMDQPYVLPTHLRRNIAMARLYSLPGAPSAEDGDSSPSQAPLESTEDEENSAREVDNQPRVLS